LHTFGYHVIARIPIPPDAFRWYRKHNRPTGKPTFATKSPALQPVPPTELELRPGAPMALSVLKDIRRIYAGLNADEIRGAAYRDLNIGLMAAGEPAYREMEEFF